ncbi:MAG: hypothetical protein N3A69_06410 [Leptospiraceae bacterium]|nr:hypothetical protein [Leptospiraceae bacterium]
MQNFLNWKIQKGIFVSIASFLGMSTLLWVFPSKAEIKKGTVTSQEKKAGQTFFKKSQDFSTSENLNSRETKSENFFSDYNNSNFNALNLNFQTNTSSDYLTSPDSFNLNVYTYSTTRNFYREVVTPEFTKSQRGNYSVELNYQITPYLSTELNVVYNTLSFQTNRDFSSINTGIQLKPNQYFSTSFLTGETFFYWNRNQNPGLYYLENSFLTPSERRNNFELRTEIRPVKNLFFQTSVYNTEQLVDEVNSTQGTKFIFGYGSNFLQLSLRYSYIGNQLFRTGRMFENNFQTKDAGGVGVTIFLDKNRNFSLYLGNNYFNLFNTPRYEDRTSSPYTTSYTASLRGRALGKGFLFLNFRNQINKDLQYFNFGTFRIPMQNIYQDTATSLGLELWF